MLLLVPLNIKKSRITKRNNVKILSVYDFCEFFGFSEETKREFIHFTQLALRSIRETASSSDSLSKLEQMADRYKLELQTNPKINFST